MTISNIVQIITIIILILTLIEAIKQRRAQYRPSIKIKSDQFQINWFLENDKYFAIDWVEKNNTEKTTFGASCRKSLEFKNIGLATAKDINFMWNFDVNFILNEIRKFSDEVNVEIHNLWIRINYSTALGGLINYPLDKKQFVEYVLPVSVDNNIHMVELPISYLQLLSAYYDILIKKDALKYYKKFPVSLTINYTDIGNKKIIERYLITPQIWTAKAVQNDDPIKAITGKFLVQSQSDFFG